MTDLHQIVTGQATPQGSGAMGVINGNPYGNSIQNVVDPQAAYRARVALAAQQAAAQSGQAAQQQAQEDSSAHAQQVAQQAQNQTLAHQNTMRTMELLRQSVGQGQNMGIHHLRQQLASRGLLASGNLGAGVTRLGVNAGDTMARGALGAANNENDTIMALLNHQNDQNFAAKQQQAQIAAQMQAIQLQSQLERQNQRPWWEQAIMNGVGGLGNAAGAGVGNWLTGGNTSQSNSSVT